MAPLTEEKLQAIAAREVLRRDPETCGFCRGRSSTCEDCCGSGMTDASREAARLRDVDRADLLVEVRRLRASLRRLANDWEAQWCSPKELYGAHARELRALLGEALIGERS